MTDVTTYMTDDHRRCDTLFADLEAAVNDGDWDAASAGLEQFLDGMNHHFSIEEEQLFPEFERLTGMAMGPTRIMRSEHEQMRALFEELRIGLAEQDEETVLGTAETLNVLMQQHNLKEEEILYPMTDQALGEEADDFARRLGAGA
ncbi:MAG: hemerythrin domain-containing protein [Gammaproteobacteria bacterium]|nr:hemerythrin domain-containing protein [Gammaproteobacteria bacterium]